MNCSHNPRHIAANWAIIQDDSVSDRFESKIAAERYLPGYPIGATVQYSLDPNPCGDEEDSNGTE